MKTPITVLRNGLTGALLTLGAASLLLSCNPNNADDDSSITPAPPSSTVTAPTRVTATGSLTDIVNQTAHLSFLKTVLVRAGLSESLKSGSRTLFAPTDGAFKAAGYTSAAMLDTLPADDLLRLLQYHLLNTRLSGSAFIVGVPTSVSTALTTTTASLFRTTDGRFYINAASVVQPDIGANNSVMYVIDRVLRIPTQTTIEVVRSRPDLSFFRLAVERAGSSVSSILLSPTERGITVFAPSNEAFQAAGYRTEDAVRSADIPRLSEIMRYHIINSRAFSPTLRSGDLSTAQGTAFGITVGAAGTRLTGRGNPSASANLLETDLVSTNGVVHVIDRVLLPVTVSQ